jgi:TolB protein
VVAVTQLISGVALVAAVLLAALVALAVGLSNSGPETSSSLITLASARETQNLYLTDIQKHISHPIAQEVDTVSAWSFDWSPDRSQIVFVDIVERTPLADTTYEIYRVAIDGGNRRKLTEGFRDLYPFWSSDGNHIVFVSNRSGQDEFFVMDVQGNTIQQITTNSGLYLQEAPAPSPDRTQIAYISQTDVGNDAFSYNDDFLLCIINEDGSHQYCLTEASFPTWSPDGQQIAFVYDWTVYAIGVDGSNLRRIATTEVVTENLYWSPDGRHIAMVSYYQNERELFIVDADGSNLYRLTHGWDGGAVWSPDGKQLIYALGRLTFDYELFVTDVDTNISSPLNLGSAEGHPLFWRP